MTGINVSEVGIDDISLHFPRLYFAMQDFAKFRGADYGKLSKGLGLEAMSIPDVHEDTATMGQNPLQRTSWICWNSVIRQSLVKNASETAMSWI